MKKEGRAGRRAEHASHFQNQQAPAGSPAAAITPELKEAVKKQKAEEARKRNVIEEWLDETGLKKKSPAGSTEMKPGQKVRFKTNRGETYTGKVVEVKENSIKFEDANGKPMTFRKDAIVESAPKTEEKWAAPGPVKIPSSEALMKHLV